jgi:hypothetical protein
MKPYRPNLILIPPVLPRPGVLMRRRLRFCVTVLLMALLLAAFVLSCAVLLSPQILLRNAWPPALLFGLCVALSVLLPWWI